MPRLLTPKEAAAELGIGEDTLRALRKAGEIAYVNIGQGRKRETPRYELADLEAWVKNRKKTATLKSPASGRRVAFTSRNAQSDYNRMCVESFERAQAERRARQDAKEARIAAADERRRRDRVWKKTQPK